MGGRGAFQNGLDFLLGYKFRYECPLTQISDDNLLRD